MVASASQALISANVCTFPSQILINKSHRFTNSNLSFTLCASSEDSDCNVEECAPDKEVGKVSMEWVAGEKTRVVGTYPPRKRGWTGYVEKDTAGQTNIYSVEPVVYVAESAISSGTAGSSADGANNTIATAGALALVSVAAASAILLQVGKQPLEVKTAEYNGPSLSYYINKFNTREIVEPPAAATAAPTTPEEVMRIQVETQPAVELD